MPWQPLWPVWGTSIEEKMEFAAAISCACHLHVFEEESPDWRRHLRFLDRLLASPDLAARYSIRLLFLALAPFVKRLIQFDFLLPLGEK
jgi:ABC-type uncharacterized transport system YnjBCD permease subunit